MWGLGHWAFDVTPHRRPDEEPREPEAAPRPQGEPLPSEARLPEIADEALVVV